MISRIKDIVLIQIFCNYTARREIRNELRNEHNSFSYGLNVVYVRISKFTQYFFYDRF